MRGQHPEGNRDRGFKRDALKTGRDRGGHIFKMRRLAPYHASRTDHRVEFARTRHLLRELGNLKSPGTIENVDRILGGSVPAQTIEGAFEQTPGNELIEPAHDYSE